MVLAAGARDVRAGGADRSATATVLDTPNPDGVLRTVAVNGVTLDPDNPFFQSLGTNGRSCASCHAPSAGWTITPPEVRERFRKTDGRDPLFRTNDGANSPRADVSSLAARRSAYSMLMTRGVIRVGMPIPDDAGNRIFLTPISFMRNSMTFFACGESAAHSMPA